MNAMAWLPPVSTIDLPYEGPTARDARRWVRGELAGLVDDETLEAVVVCISELVSNSQLHTRPSSDRKEITCRLKITTTGRVTIRGEVIDAGSPDKTPTSRQVSLCDVTGRGLSQVVTGYAEEWGHERTPVGEGMTWFVVHGDARMPRDVQPALMTEPKLPRSARAGSPWSPALERRSHITERYRPATGQSEVFEHACTPDCVPAHEHPEPGSRRLTEHIRRRRVSGEPAVRRRRRG